MERATSRWSVSQSVSRSVGRSCRWPLPERSRDGQSARTAYCRVSVRAHTSPAYKTRRVCRGRAIYWSFSSCAHQITIVLIYKPAATILSIRCCCCCCFFLSFFPRRLLTTSRSIAIGVRSLAFSLLRRSSRHVEVGRDLMWSGHTRHTVFYATVHGSMRFLRL